MEKRREERSEEERHLPAIAVEFERELVEESDVENLTKTQCIKKNVNKIRNEKKKLSKEKERLLKESKEKPVTAK